MKNPLTVLKGYLDLLRNNAIENDKNKSDFILSSYNKCCELQVLIEDLFTYNKMINGDIPMHPEKVNLVSFVKNNLGCFKENTKFKHYVENAYVMIDEKLMHRILNNLSDNINKYGNNADSSSIYINSENDKIKLIVENTTYNDLTDKVDNIFDRLYVCDENRSTNSSGLGLSIVSEAVNLMGGKIYAQFDKPVFRIIIEFNN